MATNRKEGAKLGVTVIIDKEMAQEPEKSGTKDTTKEMPGKTHRPPRSAMMWAWAHIEKYHKSHATGSDAADTNTVPTSVLHRRKHPAANTPAASQK